MTTSLAAERYGIAELIDAWESSLRAVGELGKRLTPEQWEATTECPGWSAGDVVRHSCWVEAFLVGRPAPDIALDPAQFPHVVTPFQRATEAGVELRRGTAQADVCAELDGLLEVRLAQLMALEPLALDTIVPGLFGADVPLQNVLRTRVFDLWTHEQDIRRATHLPANLATAGAQVTAHQLARSTAFVLSRNVEAPVGTTMRVRVTGPIAFERWVAVDDDGRGIDLEGTGDVTPTIALTTDWETYARLGTGRLDTHDAGVRALVELEGDPVLAARIPEALAITP
jgi:uncharacterized protein (TIGR03083 family)